MTEAIPGLEIYANGVALIELRRPGHANRIQIEDLAALHQHLCECEANLAINAVVLAAQGEHFSAGFDLRALKERAAQNISTGGDEVAFEAFADRLAQSRLATIAAVSGPAIGGATDLVLACDIRLGGPTASLRMPAARFGLPLYASAIERYFIHFGIDRAKSLIFTGRTMPAAELAAIGILSEVIAPETLRERALALAQRIASMPPEPLAAMKTALNQFAGSHIEKMAVREKLDAAFDGPAIIARIDAARAAPRPS